MPQSDNYKKRAVELRRNARAHLVEMRRARLAKQKGGAAQPTPPAQEEPQMAEEAVMSSAEPVSDTIAEPAPETATDDALSDALNDMAVKNAAMAEMAADEPTKESASEVPQDTTFEDERRAEDATAEVSIAAAADRSAAEQSAVAPEVDEMLEETPEVEPVAHEIAADMTDIAAEGPDHTAQPDDSYPAIDTSEETHMTQNDPTESDVPAQDTLASDSQDAPQFGDDGNDALMQSDLAELPGAGPGLVWMLNQCEVFTLADLAASDSATLTRKLGLVGQILNVDQWIKHAQGKTAGFQQAG